MLVIARSGPRPPARVRRFEHRNGTGGVHRDGFDGRSADAFGQVDIRLRGKIGLITSGGGGLRRSRQPGAAG
jgi:hypothetical protein